jgi:hypothetical protein
MASFAKLGLNNKVIEVLSVHNNELLDSKGVEQEVNGIDFLTKLTGYPLWKQTSYNHNIRKNHAGIGDTYDEARDAFIASQSYPSWTLDEDTCRWKAPVAYPDDGKIYGWDEENKKWIEGY